MGDSSSSDDTQDARTPSPQIHGGQADSEDTEDTISNFPDLGTYGQHIDDATGLVVDCHGSDPHAFSLFYDLDPGRRVPDVAQTYQEDWGWGAYENEPSHLILPPGGWSKIWRAAAMHHDRLIDALIKTVQDDTMALLSACNKFGAPSVVAVMVMPYVHQYKDHVGFPRRIRWRCDRRHVITLDKHTFVRRATNAFLSSPLVAQMTNNLTRVGVIRQDGHVFTQDWRLVYGVATTHISDANPDTGVHEESFQYNHGTLLGFYTHVGLTRIRLEMERRRMQMNEMHLSLMLHGITSTHTDEEQEHFMRNANVMSLIQDCKCNACRSNHELKLCIFDVRNILRREQEDEPPSKRARKRGRKRGRKWARKTGPRVNQHE